jgi:hypothetical protein
MGGFVAVEVAPRETKVYRIRPFQSLNRKMFSFRSNLALFMA